MLQGDHRLGPFELVRPLGEGGMAEVFLARTRGIGGFEKYCALKLIHADLANDESFVQMLIDEAKIAVMLTHANIAQVFDLGVDRGRYYISMEFIDGMELGDVTRALGPVTADTAAFILREVCRGLDYAHNHRGPDGRQLGLIHRDISSQNVLISSSGEVRIVDFGIARSSGSARTQTGVIKGKCLYMSPEQAQGQPLDCRSDIFSAGVVMYEAVTGKAPFDDYGMDVLLERVRRGGVPSPAGLRPDLPPDLERIIMRSLATRPEDRWQTAADFESALTGFLSTRSTVCTRNDLVQLVEAARARTDERERNAPFLQSTPHAQLLTRPKIPLDDNSVLARLDELTRPGVRASAADALRGTDTQPAADWNQRLGAATEPVFDEDILVDMRADESHSTGPLEQLEPSAGPSSAPDGHPATPAATGVDDSEATRSLRRPIEASAGASSADNPGLADLPTAPRAADESRTTQPHLSATAQVGVLDYRRAAEARGAPFAPGWWALLVFLLAAIAVGVAVAWWFFGLDLVR